ncbi:sigma factor [Nonomuraea sp. NPDC052265]|uniref:sigma factor n=1 Tax=Nonomuraea sp. NPDC052265 TaxID=3364374 RepID=UPI0037CACFA4
MRGDQRTAEELLASARDGDGEAFRGLVEPYRHELQVHCYRILGSVQGAEDLLQETLLAAWRGIGGYEERASLRTWLYRIATNRWLNALRAGARRRHEHAAYRAELPMPEPSRRREEPSWLEPYPDVLLAGIADDVPGPGGPVRGQGVGVAGLPRGAASTAAEAAGRAGAAGRPGLSGRRGGDRSRHVRERRDHGAETSAGRAGT